MTIPGKAFSLVFFLPPQMLLYSTPHLSALRKKNMQPTKVAGKKKKHRVLIYALSTCVWCKRTKQLLKDNGVEFEYADIDLCSPKDQEEIRKDIVKHGGHISFPTIIIDDKTVITGFREEKIKEALELDNT
jgi:glutaredoxin